MCACIKDLEEKLKERLNGTEDFGKMKPKGGVLKCLMAANKALMMPSFKSRLNIPFTATWDIGGKRKETNISVIASHCPFCGKEFETAAEKSEANLSESES